MRAYLQKKKKKRHLEHIREFARQLFEIWDPEATGTIQVRELVTCLISLGICSTKDIVIRMLTIIFRRAVVQEEHIKIVEFLQIFDG